MARQLLNVILLAGLIVTPLALGKVTEEEAALLGTSLTPLGGEKAGNEDGSIPTWAGSMRGQPEGLDYDGPGTPYPDPYASDEKLFTITAKNKHSK